MFDRQRSLARRVIAVALLCALTAPVPPAGAEYPEVLPMIEVGIPLEPLDPGWETVALNDMDPSLLVRNADEILAELRRNTANPGFLDQLVASFGNTRTAGYLLRVLDFLLRYVGVAFGFNQAPPTDRSIGGQYDSALDSIESGRLGATPMPAYSYAGGGAVELRLSDVLSAILNEADAVEGRREGFSIKPGVQFLVIPTELNSGGSYRVLSEIQVRFRYDFKLRRHSPMRVEVIPRCLVGLGINDTAGFAEHMYAYSGVTFNVAGQELSCSLGAAFYWGM